MHSGVELLLPVAVPVNEHRYVAVGEGRLLVGNGVERDAGIGDDAFAILPRDLAMQFGAVGFQSLALHPVRGTADLALWFEIDALIGKAAAIDARVYVEFGKARVDVGLPAFAPALDILMIVPFAHLRPEASGAVLALPDLPHGEHDMGMGFGLAIRAYVPMHIEVGDHAAIDKLGGHEISRQFDALRLGHFARNGELDFARKLGVLAFFECLDIVPEALAVAPLFGRTFRQHDFAMLDARAGAEIMVGGAARRATDDLNGEMEDRHDDRPSTTLKRTSE